MTSAEASQLLELPPTATPEQIETRFHELRTKLEEKIGKAPTPGLKAKYRASLAEITTAFETLTLEADSSDLPVLQRATPAKPAAAPVGAPPASAAESPARPPASARPAPKKSGGNREFIIVAVIAVALLGGGGWWVLKIRAEAAEKARVEAVAKAEAERKVAAEKADAEKEKARQETTFAQLRATQAEAKIRWDGVEKDEATAERKLAELKADARNTKDVPPPQLAEMQARLAAEGDYVEWLQPYVARHPAKTLLAKLDALLSAKAMEAAAPVATEITQSLTTAEQTIVDQKKSLLALTSPVSLTSVPDGLAYSYTDAYGHTVEGTTPFTGELPFGALAVRVQHSGWADYKLKTRVQRGEPLQLNAVFDTGRLQVGSTPSGLPFEVTNAAGYAKRGTTPAELTDVPAGAVSIRFTRQGWPEQTRTVELARSATATAAADFSPGRLVITSTPGGAEVVSDGTVLGRTPLTLPEVIPGRQSAELRLKGYKPQTVTGRAVAHEELRLEATLEKSFYPQAGEPWENTLGMKFVPVPGVDALFGVWDVRVQDYQAFVNETRRDWPKPDFAQGPTHPAVNVSWNDAQAFCAWLTKKEQAAGRLGSNQKYRLPTDAEWSVAVGLDEPRGGTPRSKDNKIQNVYPWGTQWPPPRGAGNLGDETAKRAHSNWPIIVGYDDGFADTSPVGSFAANRFGLYDMGGNVTQWCEDLYDGNSRERVQRGQPFYYNFREYELSSHRDYHVPSVFDDRIGFRVVVAVGGASSS